MDRLGLTVVHPDLGELRLGLLGRHQAANAAVALGTLDALRAAGHRRRRSRAPSGMAWQRLAGRAAWSCLAVQADEREDRHATAGRCRR